MAETFQSDSLAVRQPAPAADGAGQAPTDESQASSTAPISPQIKDQLGRRSAAADRNGKHGVRGLDKVLVPNHLFVAATLLTVATADGQYLRCGGRRRAAIERAAGRQRGADPPPWPRAASRTAPWAPQVSVQPADLQDMQNGSSAGKARFGHADTAQHPGTGRIAGGAAGRHGCDRSGGNRRCRRIRVCRRNWQRHSSRPRKPNHRCRRPRHCPR